MRSVEDKNCNYGSTQDNSSFEFHKGNGGNRASQHRAVLGSLGKPTPSKWDDAQKWLAGLSRGGDHSHANNKPRSSNADDRRLIEPIPQKGKDSCSSAEEGFETMNQDEGETKKIDCNESFWRINKPLDDSISVVRSVCVRDMGTEMTPIASQEPSRTGTPLRATTPNIRSPISSRSSTPGRCHPAAEDPENYQTGLKSMESRSEAAHFGRVSATGWSAKREEDSDARKMLENKNLPQARKPSSLETRALAWDEAERAKYMARYKQEEVKIQAWENHEKRKAEMEMRRIEVKAERLKSRSQEKLANKLAATRRIAEEKRANAEAKLNEQAVKTSERADYIRRTGHLPSSFSFKLPSLCW
ncbi:remorin family protein [Tasmannia lanceolata]|uniref:remorin family protein n=1 Tax=Tasmannia lanceolata TaxID=3420 RepID=UPI004064697D